MAADEPIPAGTTVSQPRPSPHSDEWQVDVVRPDGATQTFAFPAEPAAAAFAQRERRRIAIGAETRQPDRP